MWWTLSPRLYDASAASILFSLLSPYPCAPENDTLRCFANESNVPRTHTWQTRRSRKCDCVLTVLPGGRPGHSNESDAATKSVIKSRKDNDPRIITTILAVLWSAITQNGIYNMSENVIFNVRHVKRTWFRSNIPTSHKWFLKEANRISSSDNFDKYFTPERLQKQQLSSRITLRFRLKEHKNRLKSSLRRKDSQEARNKIEEQKL